jgi:hypothetical protein
MNQKPCLPTALRERKETESHCGQWNSSWNFREADRVICSLRRLK